MMLGMLVPLIATSMQGAELKAGMTITRSLKVAKRTYNLPSSDDLGKTAAVVVKGNNITVDFGGSTLLGRSLNRAPDTRTGTAVLVTGKNVVIRNLKAHGYKIGLIARNAPGLKIVDCDFSYNWKQRLLSTLDKEDSSDWMSFHKNEADEWLRFGAGVYLRNCDNFEVKNVTIRNGQCGLMLTNCNKGLVWNSDFSFLSAIGLGMYRSSENRIMHNNIDWCVRGYSHGRWNRGQDSAGILIYEQSHKNKFAYNSVTHGGDGFFLWAGQTTMDTGEGGCNDNLLYGNDFSHAPTNGIEATFSRNDFINNLVLECWHGIWGGYSFESKVVGNVFAHNAQSIAWEHGQSNTVKANMFYQDTEGIVLWMNKTQDPNWGYPKKRDTKSRDWSITQNEFNNIPTNAISVRDTSGVVITKNWMSKVGTATKLDGTNPCFQFVRNELWLTERALPDGEQDNKVFLDAGNKPEPATMAPSGNVILGLAPTTREYLERFEMIWTPYPSDRPLSRGLDSDEFLAAQQASTKGYAPKPMQGGTRPFLKKGSLRGRRYILVDDWGPYDFKRPLLWTRSEFKEGLATFEVLGRPGKATIREQRGVRIEAISEDGINWTVGGGGAAQVPVPGFVRVRLEGGSTNDLLLDMEYRGQTVVDDRGVVTPAGVPYRFNWSRFFLPIEWTVKFWAYDLKTQDPRTMMDAFVKNREKEPLKIYRGSELNFAWSGKPFPEVSSDHFATVSEGTFSVNKGKYLLDITSDDGVRVWVDGVKVAEDWTWHPPKTMTHTLELEGGRHTIRVEHFELDGFSTLKVDLSPVR